MINRKHRFLLYIEEQPNSHRPHVARNNKNPGRDLRGRPVRSNRTLGFDSGLRIHLWEQSVTHHRLEHVPSRPQHGGIRRKTPQPLQICG